MKFKFVIYADKEFSLEKIQACDKDSTMSLKINKNIIKYHHVIKNKQTYGVWLFFIHTQFI